MKRVSLLLLVMFLVVVAATGLAGCRELGQIVDEVVNDSGSGSSSTPSDSPGRDGGSRRAPPTEREDNTGGR